MAARPADVSSEAWLLAIALSSLVPAAIYVGMTWRVLHKMKNGTRESDQAVAVVAALSVKNAATIEKFMMLLDGLDTHPSIGELPNLGEVNKDTGCRGLWMAMHVCDQGLCLPCAQPVHAQTMLTVSMLKARTFPCNTETRQD